MIHAIYSQSTPLDDKSVYFSLSYKYGYTSLQGYIWTVQMQYLTHGSKYAYVSFQCSYRCLNTEFASDSDHWTCLDWNRTIRAQIQKCCALEAHSIPVPLQQKSIYEFRNQARKFRTPDTDVLSSLFSVVISGKTPFPFKFCFSLSFALLSKVQH